MGEGEGAVRTQSITVIPAESGDPASARPRAE